MAEGPHLMEGTPEYGHRYGEHHDEKHDDEEHDKEHHEDQCERHHEEHQVRTYRKIFMNATMKNITST